jgi:5-formyltetrahydrofolate cyclo-ligase
MHLHDLNLAKTSLRSRFRELRREISERKRQPADHAINAAITKLVAERNAARVAGFLAFDGEPDIAPALTELNLNGIEIYLPVIETGAAHDFLSFRRWPAGGASAPPGALRRNSIGIREPVVGELCAVSDFDVMLIPLVAWDESGGRLGMGAGYYDRALEGVAAATRPLRIGVAYQIQRADALPMSETDVYLHGLLTESGLFTCAR